MTPLIRIGQTMDIVTFLNFANGTPVVNAQLTYTIVYGGTDTNIIEQTTDGTGTASYSEIVPYQYANENISVNVIFSGNSTVASANSSAFENILGQLYTILTVSNVTITQVGYTTQVNGSISIQGESQYIGIFLTLAAWYDNESNTPLFVKEIYVDQFGDLSYTTPEIASGHTNLTFYMDYSGTSTIAYNSTSLTVPVLPQWNVNITYTSLASNIRIGQQLTLNITGTFLDPTCPETLFGLPVTIIYQTLITLKTFQVFFGTNNSMNNYYTIPQNAGNQLNITLQFAGDDQINSFSNTLSYQILPKWGIELILMPLPTVIRLGQTLTFNIQGEFTDQGNPESLLGIPITIQINAGVIETINDSLSQQGFANDSWTIPLNALNSMTVTISTIGTFQIGYNSINFTQSILSQVNTTIALLSSLLNKALRVISQSQRS